MFVAGHRFVGVFQFEVGGGGVSFYRLIAPRLLVRHAVMGGVLASLPGLLVDTRLMTAVIDLRVERRGDGWVLAGPDSEDVRLVNDFLGYLGDRHYAPGTRRGYAFDLLALLRWLAGQDRRLDQVDTEMLLRFLASCRNASTTAGRRASRHRRAAGGRGWRRRR